MFGPLIILLATAPRVVVDAVLPFTPQGQRAQQIVELRADLAQLPTLRIASLRRIFRLNMTDDFLIGELTDLKAEAPAHVICDGLPGEVRFNIFGATTNFSLLQQQFPPDGGQVNTSIACIAGGVQLARDAENEKESSSIQLIQDAPQGGPAPTAEGPVRLLVHRTSNDPAQAEFDLRLAAASFTQLREKYPDAVERYIRPLLCDLQQESGVFCVEPAIAQQVLGVGSRPDPAMIARASAILPRLDSENFRERRAGAEALAALGAPGAVAVASMDRTGWSLERISAVETFLARCAPLSGERARQLNGDPGFLLDILYNDDAAMRAGAIKRLREVLKQPLDLDPTLDERGRSEWIAKIRASLPTKKVEQKN